MLVSSIFLITNFKNVFACVKFCYKVLSNLPTNIFFSEIADHFPRVFLGATVTSRLAASESSEAATTSHLTTNNLEHCTRS